ncbi:MAG: hypothetical protein AB1473_02980 [Thermodesulfobacteriota bacterium]
MLEVGCTNLKELERWVSRMPPDALFRGQRHHFVKDSKANIQASFTRHGCVPPLTFKWSHYVREVICLLSGCKPEEVSIEFGQALLQHYGWRSQYVDVTSHFPVAAWFGSHAFKDNIIVSLSEDCYEQAMLLRQQQAGYSFGDGDGHLYVFDRTALEKNNVGVFDLAILEPKDFTARYSKQRALLVGPLRTTLPPETIHAHLVCPSAVLSEAAELAGFYKTEDLFPSREEDTILDALLRVPWTCLSDRDGLAAFARGLALPEYDWRHEKIFPPQNAFFRPFWIADNRGGEQLPFWNATFVRVPEEMLYPPPRPADVRLKKVCAFLRAKRSVAIEANGIIGFPEFPHDCRYGKGVFVSLVDEETAEICSIMVEHPGMQLVRSGITMPWTYRLSHDFTWIRVAGPQDCPCNNDQRHLHNFWIVATLEHMLSSGEFVQRTALEFDWRPASGTM